VISLFRQFLYSSVRHLIILFLFLLSSPLFALDPPRSIIVKHIKEAIKIDGRLWEAADVGGNFWQFFPMDSV